MPIKEKNNTGDLCPLLLFLLLLLLLYSGLKNMERCIIDKKKVWIPPIVFPPWAKRHWRVHSRPGELSPELRRRKYSWASSMVQGRARAASGNLAVPLEQARESYEKQWQIYDSPRREMEPRVGEGEGGGRGRGRVTSGAPLYRGVSFSAGEVTRNDR